MIELLAKHHGRPPSFVLVTLPAFATNLRIGVARIWLKDLQNSTLFHTPLLFGQVQNRSGAARCCHLLAGQKNARALVGSGCFGHRVAERKSRRLTLRISPLHQLNTHGERIFEHVFYFLVYLVIFVLIILFIFF